MRRQTVHPHSVLENRGDETSTSSDGDASPSDNTSKSWYGGSGVPSINSSVGQLGNDDYFRRQLHKRATSDGYHLASPVAARRGARNTSLQNLRDMVSVTWRAARRPSRVWRARLRAIGLVLLTLLVLDAWLITSNRPHGTRVAPHDAERRGKKPLVFIAGIHRNSEKILKSHWSKALVELVKFYGTAETYVSLYESGSIVDNTKSVLWDLNIQLENLGVRRGIVLDDIDQISEVGREVLEKEDDWIWTRRERFELRRIPYLSNARNKVMQKLYEEEAQGRRYDIVLWINDVVFTTEDITTLLATNDGQYDAVCAMDYKEPHSYYDTFALRDFHGSKALPGTWPYFTYSPSRDRLVALEPVPVKACWNGVVAFRSEPFYDTPRLQFRGVPDSLASYHLEGSECCLIHADNNGTHTGKGVWLNPNVRVGYNGAAYEAVNPKGWTWPPAREKLWGMWLNRWQRLMYWPWRRLEARVVRNRVGRWADEQSMLTGRGHGEAEYCLINEMQVLESAGWRHV